LSYRLVAIDLDGTLLNAERRIPEDLVLLIRENANRGVMFTIATGRHYPSALPFAQELELDIPIITYNGAMTRCSQSGEVLRHLTINKSTALKVLSRMTAHTPAVRYIYLDDTIYADREHPHADGYARALRVTITCSPDLEELVRGTDPTLMAFVLAADAVPLVKESLKDEFGDQILVTNSLDNFLEVLHPQAGKGKSLADLAERLGIRREEILAIGDSWNDLDMIDYAGTGALVGNAPRELWNQADFVSAKPRSDGVVDILRHFL